MKYIILTLGMISVISLNSCNRDESSIETPKVDILDKNYIQKASMNEKLAYKKYYLKEALKEVTKMGFTSDDLVAISKDSKYQKDVVLFSDILSYAKSEKKIDIANPRIEKILNAFKELDGSNYDISFYIPFADKLNNHSSKAVTSDIYIFEQEDDSEQLAFEGVVLNEDGEYVTYDQLITEQMAEDLAEQQGRKVVIVGLADVAVINTGGENQGNSAPKYNYFNISNMIVKSHKESWISGASDVAIVAERKFGTYFYNAVSLHAGGDGWDYLFRRVTRKEVRKQTNLSVNTTLINVERASMPLVGSDPNYVIHYVIYEADMWPIGNRNLTFVYNGVSHDIKYRSSDGPYDYKTLVRNDGQVNYYTDNQDIKYWASFSNQYK